jgi:glycosyltransferase involved in cell wall biosynthesis
MRLRLGIFFTHPTQHHSVLFNRLADRGRLHVDSFYFDPGPWAGMHDSGYGRNNSWDIETRHSSASVLWNPFRKNEVVHQRQFNPTIIHKVVFGEYDWIFVASYSSPSSWLAVILAALLRTNVLYQSDTNYLNEVAKRSSFTRNLIIAAFQKMVTRFLAVGNWNLAAYIMHGALPKEIAFCPYPVDVKRLKEQDHDSSKVRLERRQQLEVNPDVCVFIFCGKLISRKRPGDFCAAVERIKDLDVAAVVIGSGPLEQDLRRQFQSNKIKFVGFQNQQEIPRWMKAGDVGVVCSDYDPHPLVCTEMAACGLPLIVSNMCGVYGENDILVPGHNGITYRVGDVAELARIMSDLARDHVMRSRFSRNSLRLADSQDVGTAVAKIETLLQYSEEVRAVL